VFATTRSKFKLPMLTTVCPWKAANETENKFFSWATSGLRCRKSSSAPMISVRTKLAASFSVSIRFVLHAYAKYVSRKPSRHCSFDAGILQHVVQLVDGLTRAMFARPRPAWFVPRRCSVNLTSARGTSWDVLGEYWPCRREHPLPGLSA
jgi:hypothetical protein